MKQISMSRNEFGLWVLGVGIFWAVVCWITIAVFNKPREAVPWAEIAPPYQYVFSTDVATFTFVHFPEYGLCYGSCRTTSLGEVMTLEAKLRRGSELDSDALAQAIEEHLATVLETRRIFTLRVEMVAGEFVVDSDTSARFRD